MMDNPRAGNRRFYLTDSTAGVVELAKGISNSFSPCVVMESRVEGGGKVAMPVRNYTIYFFVRASKMADGDAAAEAKEEAWVHAKNFLAWLLKRHEDDVPNGDYGLIDMEDSLMIDTVGPIENGWFAVCIQFERMEPINTCVDEEMYMDCGGC